MVVVNECRWANDVEHLAVWGDEKPLALMGLCSQLVTEATAAHEILEANRLKEGPLWRIQCPNDDVWFQLYSSHRTVRYGLLEALGADRDWSDKWMSLLDCLSWCTNADGDVVGRGIREALAGSARGRIGG